MEGPGDLLVQAGADHSLLEALAGHEGVDRDLAGLKI